MAYGLVLYIVQSPGTIEVANVGSFATEEAAETAGDALITAFADGQNKVRYGVIASTALSDGVIEYGDIDPTSIADSTDVDNGTAGKLVDAATLRAVLDALA